MRGRAPAWLVAAVVGLGLVAGVMLAILLVTRAGEPVGQGSPSPTAVASPSTNPSGSASASASPNVLPSASARPSPTPTPSGPARIGWRAGGEGSGGINDVIRFGDGWIAGGSNDDWLAEAWLSTDGRTWTDPVAVGPVPGNEQFSSIGAFAERDGGLLAFVSSGDRSNDSRFALLYRSTDGRTWEPVDVAGTPYGETWHLPWEAVETPDGRLALLSLTDLGAGASVYVTGDLVAWEEHPITEADRNLVPSVFVSGIAASNSLLLAVGTEQFPYEDTDPPRMAQRAWTSTDAATWTPISPPTPGGTLNDVAWDPVRERFVVVGTTEDGLPRAWLTTDGTRWSSITLGGEPVQMQRVVAADGLIVATGVDGDPFDLDSGHAIAWSSHDGVTWWYRPVLDGQAHTAVAATSDSAVMVANQWDEQGTEWWIPLAGAVEPLE